jgi:DNA-binding transcriptional ArsR family regulator
MTESLTTTAAAHKALGHPVRLRVVAMLASGELCVCQITAVLKLAVSTVSAHLAELKRAGLVAEQKQGRWVIYRQSESESARLLITTSLRGLDRDPRIAADTRIIKRLRRVPLEELCRVDLDLSRVGIAADGAPAKA